MKTLVRSSYVQVIGRIWMPNATCAMQYDLYPKTWDRVDELKDAEGRLTRESVEDWLSTHSGDFQSIEDFSASLEDGDETVDIPWANEESELTYNDCASERGYEED